MLFRLRSHLKNSCFWFHQGFRAFICFSVFGTPNEALALGFDILHETLLYVSCLIYYLTNFAFSGQNWNVVSSLRKRYQAIVPVRTNKISCKFANSYNTRVELISLALFFHWVKNPLTWTTCKIRHHVSTTSDARIRNLKCKNKNILKVLKSSKYIWLTRLEERNIFRGF